jgi:equilibrative nucleoside transporter 1/2/3
MQDTQFTLWMLLFIFTITFIVYPALYEATSFDFLEGVNQAFSWFILICATIFNIGDTIGRKLGGVPMFMLSIRWLVILSIARCLFIVTFFFTAYQIPPENLWNSDWFKILNMSLFAFSNGYLATVCCVKAPGTVKPDQMGQVGGLIGIIIATGIMIGSLVAIPLGKAIADSPGQ